MQYLKRGRVYEGISDYFLAFTAMRGCHGSTLVSVALAWRAAEAVTSDYTYHPLSREGKWEVKKRGNKCRRKHVLKGWMLNITVKKGDFSQNNAPFSQGLKKELIKQKCSWSTCCFKGYIYEKNMDWTRVQVPKFMLQSSKYMYIYFVVNIFIVFHEFMLKFLSSLREIKSCHAEKKGTVDGLLMKTTQK